LVVQVMRRATRLRIRRHLRTKNVTAQNTSKSTMTMAAITPPERWEELLSPPARMESGEDTEEVIPPVIGAAVLPETELWRIVLDVSGVVVGVETGGDDGGGDDPMAAERVELGAGLENVNPSGIISAGVGTSSLMGMDVFAMLDAGTSATMAVGDGASVEERGGPFWSS
jgi:hypothetical protein